MTTRIEDILKYAEKKFKKLRADDQRLNRSVTIALDDGSYFHWENAFIEDKDDWNIVYTEHYGHHAFHKSDCLYEIEHTRVYEKETE